MSPPERTLGPIGWKGLFGDDDDEPEDERITDDGTPTGDAGTSDGRAAQREPGERLTRQREPDRSGPDGGGGTDSGRGTAAGSEPVEGAGAGDRGSDVDDRVREERARSAEELSEDEGTGCDTRAPDAESGDGRIDAEEAASRANDPAETSAEPDAAADAPATRSVDEPGAGAEPADAGRRSRAEEGAAATAGDTSKIWVNPLDDEPEETTAGPSDWERGIVDAASRPADEPRVRTDRSDTHEGSSTASDPEVTSAGPESTTGEPARTAGKPETKGDDAEFTLGPIGIKGLPARADDTEEEPVSTTEAQPARRREHSRSSTVSRREPSQLPEASHTGTAAEDEEASLLDPLTSRVPWSISLTAIGVGVGLLVFLDIVSMMVPLIAAIGAGIVGGFVAGYISGGTVRGGLHALVVGIIGGISVGYLTALIGALIGLFLEPATLVGSVIGPVAPELGLFGAWGPLLVMVFVTVMVAIDATIAGVVGGTVRSVVDDAR